MSGPWIGILVGVLTSLLTTELSDISAWVAPWIIRKAANRISSEVDRRRYLEEWEAELCSFDGLKLIKLGKAVSIWLYSAGSEKALQGYDLVTFRIYAKTIYSYRIKPFISDRENIEYLKTNGHNVAAHICGIYWGTAALPDRISFADISTGEVCFTLVYSTPVRLLHRAVTKPILVLIRDYSLLRRGCGLRKVIRAHREPPFL